MTFTLISFNFAMRSSRALLLFSKLCRPSIQLLSSTRLPLLRNDYCSVCDAAKAGLTGTAKTIKKQSTSAADHRQLGIEQDLFITSKYSPGSPLFGPNGARMFNKLTNFLRAQYNHFGFEEVITPTIYKQSLWEKSGHWENYKDDMYSVIGRGATGQREGKEIQEDEEYGLKPMNCPGHCLIFGSKARSYREMPVRFADFSALHRNEVSGSLSGLTRVRRFHQDDGHIFCRPSQIGPEISQSLEFVRMVYQTLGLGPYRLTLSTRPKDSFIGTIEEWDSAETALKKSLDESGQVWTLNEEDGAFYGPKIDIILKDSDGKEHQTATIQLDFQLPKRFELEYQAPAPELEKKGESTSDPELLAVSGPVTPVLIHRAVLGSVERLMALLIEHYNGKYPFWLNPRQAIVITVNDENTVVDYAKSLIGYLNRVVSFNGIPTTITQAEIPTPDGLPWARRREAHHFNIDLDDSPRSVGKKISEAKRNRYSVIMVVGRRDVKQGTASVDLSSIPDPHGWVLVSVNGTAPEVIDPPGNSAQEKPEVRIVPDLEPRDITAEQLGNLSFGWARLRALLCSMDDRYI